MFMFHKFTGAILVVIIVFAISFVLRSSFMVSLSNHEQLPAFAIETTQPTSAQSAILLGQKIDVNSATKEDLEALPGVGPSLAERIVKYRETHRRFKTIDDLDNVSGIGPKTVERLKGFLK